MLVLRLVYIILDV